MKLKTKLSVSTGLVICSKRIVGQNLGIFKALSSFQKPQNITGKKAVFFVLKVLSRCQSEPLPRNFEKQRIVTSCVLNTDK